MLPKLLLIESSTLPFSVAISDGEKILAQYIHREKGSLASHITLAIQVVLDQSGVTLNEIQAIGVSAGPGSYTGLRIGLSTAKGICYALSLPLIMIESTYALADQVSRKLKIHADELILPMVDARRQEVYASGYDYNLKHILPLAPMIFPQAFENSLLHLPYSFILSGDGADKSFSYFPQGRATLTGITQNAANLAKPAADMFAAKQFTSISEAGPIYLKPPNITHSDKLAKLLKKP